LPWKSDLVYQVVNSQLSSSRTNVAHAKTRAEVRGGGKKPWKQKGTGRARAGSSRSPLWVGGGVTFGPKPRLVTKKINKKENRLAILSAIYLKKNNFTFVNENLFTDFSVIKTKEIKKLIHNLNLNFDAKILFVLPSPNKQFWLASRNLKNIEVTTVNCLNIKQLLKPNHIVLANSSFDLINSIYGKQYA
jgi:large subunit ribosomal protein L4